MTDQITAEKPMSLKEIADFIGYTASYVPTLIRKGLPCTKIGGRGHYRFFPSLVVAWMQRKGMKRGA